jgi:hypothetical protein
MDAGVMIPIAPGKEPTPKPQPQKENLNPLFSGSGTTDIFKASFGYRPRKAGWAAGSGMALAKA